MSYYEQVALTMLRRYGLKTVWQLHLSAARAYSDGNAMAALSMIEIADAAERELQKRKLADLPNRTDTK